MNKPAIRISAAAVASALGLMAATSAHAVSFTQGDWGLDINGTINAFYVNSDQKTTVGGVTTKNQQTNVQNGLLPGWINFVATTKQKGFDVKAHFGFAPGINSNSSIVGLPTQSVQIVNGAPTLVGGTAYPQVDSRNVYFQFGNASMGTLKFGRDIGLFGQTAILNDMTLLGVGGTTRAAEPFNTSFGMIGHGYMYTGFQPQITYSTPNAGGFQASLGLFNPSQTTGTERKSPGFQGLATYDWKGSMNGKLWGAFVNQKTSGVGGTKANGYDVGAKLGFGRFEALASAFTGKGIGASTVGAQFNNVLDISGQRMKSSGHFIQGTFQASDDLKLGLNYGRNKDENKVAAGADTTNKAVTLGAYYKLMPSVTLVGEVINEKARNIAVSGAGVFTDVKTNSVNLGAILFF